MVGVAEGFAFGGWDRCGTHDLFGVGLVGFELGTALGGSEDEAFGAIDSLGELVGPSFGEGVLGTDDNQTDVALVAELIESVELLVGIVDFDRVGVVGDPGVLGVGGVEGAELWGFGDRLCEGVLAGSASDEEDIDGIAWCGGLLGGHGVIVGVLDWE